MLIRLRHKNKHSRILTLPKAPYRFDTNRILRLLTLSVTEHKVGRSSNYEIVFKEDDLGDLLKAVVECMAELDEGRIDKELAKIIVDHPEVSSFNVIREVNVRNVETRTTE